MSEHDAILAVPRIADALERIADLLERPAPPHPQYQELMQVDADDDAVRAIQANPGWELLQTGVGRGGQPVLLFGFGREGT